MQESLNKSEKQIIKIVFVGQPNVGKSMLINAISKSNLKVGNFSGVTVDSINIAFEYLNYNLLITDLPGAYSLSDYTQEEKVTKEYLENNDYDLIINITDSTNLERNLYLTSELLMLNKKMIVVLNMIDEANKDGIEINALQLETILGKPVIKTSASKEIGIKELIELIIKEYNSKPRESKIRFSNVIEEEIKNIMNFLAERKFKSNLNYWTLAVNLLKKDKKTIHLFHEEPIWIELHGFVKNAYNHIYLHYNNYDIEEIFEENRVSFSKGAISETVKFKFPKKVKLTDKLDRILIHPIFGLPIFMFFIWGLFQLTFKLGQIPMDFIESSFNLLVEFVKSSFGNNEIGNMIGDGAIAGVGSVVMFLPNIIILFLGITLLETTGYMARASFLLDGFFHKFGLHGKSFIPLVTGFGCTVPAYMATRTLKNRKDKLITLFVLGFISCSARLPIYVLFIGTFFKGYNAGNLLFFIYLSGAIFSLIAAKFLRQTAFKGEDEPFVMEMPKYRLPSLRLLWHSVYGQAMSYLKKAGTFILLASALVWYASNYPKIDNKSVNIEHSYLGSIGKTVEPFFKPIGFNWKMSVAILTGLSAKEVVVSTLKVLYVDENDVKKFDPPIPDEENKSLMDSLRADISVPSAIAFLIFIMLYIPCFAAAAVFTKESGGFKYLVYLFLFTTSVAWIFSFLGYHASKFIIS
jgi:ferrous iron transport protein B